MRVRWREESQVRQLVLSPLQVRQLALQAVQVEVELTVVR